MNNNLHSIALADTTEIIQICTTITQLHYSIQNISLFTHKIFTYHKYTTVNVPGDDLIHTTVIFYFINLSNYFLKCKYITTPANT